MSTIATSNNFCARFSQANAACAASFASSFDANPICLFGDTVCAVSLFVVAVLLLGLGVVAVRGIAAAILAVIFIVRIICLPVIDRAKQRTCARWMSF
ncbi:MAG: hypothetical protein IJL15_04255 [Clostridia bacterium]|nr:hypothetical protein [Clostridia bacterium]